jgi:glutaminyl-tRNA synthetase
MSTETPEAPPKPSDFIRDIVAADVASGKVQRVVTRFPPEPNGYLHIGHAKAICLNAGIALEFGGVFNLRMDDTNPAKEEVEYVESIIEDVKWLIGGWADHVLRFKHRGDTSGRGLPAFCRASAPLAEGDAAGGAPALQLDPNAEPFYASDYFQQLHDYAVLLIKAGKAYVDDLTPEQTDAYRGAPGEPGRPSPWRERSIEENLDLFARMKSGEFPDAARSLRAKIDMAHPNVWMRDPLLYRIRHTAHHHTGNAWCIYPLYDYAHCLSDSIEGVTHSLCSLEFVVHRPLYDWIVDALPVPQPRPHQYEFAKLMPTHVVISKRKLLAFVNEGIVSGWDDPRMPTLSGLRRRGIPAEAVRNFAIGVGVTKFVSSTDIAVFEHAIRSDLNTRAQRRLAVLDPIKVVITNYPEGQTEELTATNNPSQPDSGTRPIPFSREIWIERDDFAEIPPPKFFRLKPGGEVRLKYAYIIKCDEVVKDADGKITELRCTADLDSKTGGPTSSRKIKGTIHWVSAPHAIDAEVRLYDRLFQDAEPEADGRDWRTAVNPHSLDVVTAKIEPSLRDATLADRFQFERLAYFSLDSKDSASGKLVFNRIITLKDTWAKEAQKA